MLATPGQSPLTHQEIASEDQANAHHSSHTDAPSLGERPTDELPDYEETIYWAPEESEEETEVRKISDTTAKVLRDSFSAAMNKRRSVKRKQPVPDTVFTKFPKLDPSVMSKLPKTAKEADCSLARLEPLVLDAAKPLVSVLESACKGLLTPKDAAEATQQAHRLLGNASAKNSGENERRQPGT